MHIHLISMLRNEKDVLTSFLGHVAGLFDSGDLVDHISTDGSDVLMQQFCRVMPGWSFGRLNCQAYMQAAVCNTLMHRAFARGADAVLFLDADEFIHGLTRDQLREAADILQQNRLVGTLFWRNCVPEKLQDSFQITAPSWIGPLSPHKKIFIPKWVHSTYGSSARVNQGNHSIAINGGEAPSLVQAGEILHFPIRSERQFTRKIVSTFLAQLQAGPAPHIQQMIRLIADGNVDDASINALAMRYGEKFSGAGGMNRADLQKAGAILQVPDVALSDSINVHAMAGILASIPSSAVKPPGQTMEKTLSIGDEVYQLD